MNSRTVLVDPTALTPLPAPPPTLPPLAATRWVTYAAEVPTWTMVHPGLRRRHRRVAALAFAPRHPRVLVGQIVVPTVVVCAVGAFVGAGLAWMFPSTFVPGWLIIGFLLVVAVAAAVLQLTTRWRQGKAQARHVVQVSSNHAQALIDIEAAISAYNTTCQRSDARLSAPELLWNAAHDSRAAIAIARTLAVLPPEEDVRVLDGLRTLIPRGQGPGNVTVLENMVHTPTP